MQIAGPDLFATLGLTLRHPRQAARAVIGWPLSAGERWIVLALMAVATTLSAEAFLLLAPEAADPSMAMILANPVAFAALQFAGLVVMAGLIFAIGRQFGGSGSFSEGLAIINWLQVVLVVMQVIQIMALLIVPPLAILTGLASLVLTLWLMPNFIAELHGFRSAFLTFLVMIGAMFALVVILSLILVFVFGVRG